MSSTSEDEGYPEDMDQDKHDDSSDDSDSDRSDADSDGEDFLHRDNDKEREGGEERKSGMIWEGIDWGLIFRKINTI